MVNVLIVKNDVSISEGNGEGSGKLNRKLGKDNFSVPPIAFFKT